MKLLHSSDWHLGRSLFGEKRYWEFDSLFQWLLDLIESEGIDTLLVAGDIFDNGIPNHKSLEHYFRFLADLARTCCRNIVLIAGNHDSPSLLNASKSVLDIIKNLNVYVIGKMDEERPEDEVIVLYDDARRPEAIVCAVPYLHDRDIRSIDAGETPEIKAAKLVEGIREHYRIIGGLAEAKQKELREGAETAREIPIIVMGHLFTRGGRTVKDDGVRELYVGNLAGVEADVFPASADYVALGHLHIPQRVGENGNIRYSGSLLPIGFGAVDHDKQVVLVEFDGRRPRITEKILPRFITLKKLSGTLPRILESITELKGRREKILLEIDYTGEEIVSDLQKIVNDAVTGSELVVCRLWNRRFDMGSLTASEPGKSLEELDLDDVFKECLVQSKVPENKRDSLTALYHEIVQSIHEEDANAE